MHKRIALTFLLLATAGIAKVYSIKEYVARPLNPTQAFNAAIADASAAGGGEIFIDHGVYSINATIIVPGNIVFRGEGASSIVNCGLDIPIFKTESGASNVEFNDFMIEYTGSHGNSFQIEGINTWGLVVSNMKVNAPAGGKFAGIRVWNGQDTSAGASGGTTMIRNSTIAQGLVWLNQSDTKILNNFIWSNERITNSPMPYSIRIGGGAGNSYISGNDIVPGTFCGIHISRGYNLRIEGNFFDGSYDLCKTGWGIYGANPTRTTISGNTFWNLYKGGIQLMLPYNTTVANNTFFNNNREKLAGNHDVYAFSDNNPPGIGLTYTGNQHNLDGSQGANPAAPFRAVNCLSTVLNNSVIGNYASPRFLTYDGGQNMDRRNINSMNRDQAEIEKLNDREGVVMFSSGVQSKYISFGTPLWVNPKISELSINLIAAVAGSSPLPYMISGLDKNGFNIVFSSGLPANLNVSWKYSFVPGS